ncbi:MAG TPA: hypothetical protein VF062_11580 [Candidatus Limnocylindrales bacterium]
MFNGLYDIDWSSMQHAYGSAEEVPVLLLAMRSADAEERREALSEFYGAVHHQGDVYPCTTASLPFLFELAADAATPDRGAIVTLLVSIGSAAVDRAGHCDGEDEYYGVVDYAGAARVMRERAGVFVGLASDPDRRVRQAAIPGLAWFLDDGDLAAAVLRGRLPAEPDVVERLLVVEAMATLALRLPALSREAMAWFAALAADPASGPETRLAAMVQRARCAPPQIGEDAVPAAIGLLREMAQTTVPKGMWQDPPRQAAPDDGVPPQIVAAFEDLDRMQQVHAPTTDLLRTFHKALAGRVAQRTALLAEQLRSPDPGARLDALRMSAELMEAWRGDHTSLITLVAQHLDATDHEAAAEAAYVLDGCHPIAEPARNVLAAYVVAQRVAHGPDVWAAPQPPLRRAHQEAVRALARLGDTRAAPSVLAALDTGVETWRAIEVAGTLTQDAGRLGPRLRDQLRRLDLAQQWVEMSASPILSALSALGDRDALPVIADTLREAVRHEQWQVTSSALQALAASGPAAAPFLESIRPLTAASETHVRPAAVAALWAIGGDRDEVMPLLLDLLDDRIAFRIMDAAGVLGEIGPPGAAALPRLRELLRHNYEWVRVQCAAALWEIGGDAEVPSVLETLLRAWEHNPATANHVVACLNRMGMAAQPALPLLRAQLALPRRGGRFATIEDDEELQRISRTVIERLSRAAEKD